MKNINSLLIAAGILALASCGTRDQTNKTGSLENSTEGAIALSGSGSSSQSGGTTVICHIPPGNPSAAHSIVVGNPAVSAHVAHGDYVHASLVAGTACSATPPGSGGGNPPPPPPPDGGEGGEGEGGLPPPPSGEPD